MIYRDLNRDTQEDRGVHWGGQRGGNFQEKGHRGGPPLYFSLEKSLEGEVGAKGEVILYSLYKKLSRQV